MYSTHLLPILIEIITISFKFIEISINKTVRVLKHRAVTLSA